VKWLLAIGVCLASAMNAPAQSWPPRRQSAPQASAPAAPQSIHPAVARIVAPGNSSISYGSGTLVYVDGDAGIVITNWHVVNEATGPISVHFPDGFYSLGTVRRFDRDWDLAAIVIRKPNVPPVSVANAAPRPGEMLTIAGYGAGSYRAASGVCTQYVAPGTTFPYEMVEVAVSARQGDSGGPILNSHGELAGVLFGEGGGRTSGSYCGRVRWFLSSVVPDIGNVNQVQLATTPASSPGRPNTGPRAPVAGRNESVGAAVPEVSIASMPVVPIRQASQPVAANSNPVVPVGAITARPPTADTQPPGEYLGWEDIAGHSLGEQAKTVLAAIGVLAIILHSLRLLSRE
jgi:hypothetical protein